MKDTGPGQEVRTKQFVFHNLDSDSRGAPTETSEAIQRIKKDGLWSPVDHSIISSDIFFWGGSHGTITVVSRTPHSESDEFAGRKYSWDKVRLMEPSGEVYEPDDTRIPSYIKEIYNREGVRKEKAKKGFKHIPPEDIRAIISWSDEVHDFKNGCNRILQQYEQGENTELVAVKNICSLGLKIPMEIEIIDSTLDKQKILSKIATSLTLLRLRERHEELLYALCDLERGNMAGVNSYLSDFCADIDMFAFQNGNIDAIIQDRAELLKRLKKRLEELEKFKPSFSDAKEAITSYRMDIVNEIDQISE